MAFKFIKLKWRLQDEQQVYSVFQFHVCKRPIYTSPAPPRASLHTTSLAGFMKITFECTTSHSIWPTMSARKRMKTLPGIKHIIRPVVWRSGWFDCQLRRLVEPSVTTLTFARLRYATPACYYRDVRSAFNAYEWNRACRQLGVEHWYEYSKLVTCRTTSLQWRHCLRHVCLYISHFKVH